MTPRQRYEFEGSCLCGSIRYGFDAEPFDCCYCHCSICRKLTGTGYGAYGSVVRGDFVWARGEQLLKLFKPTPATTRYFCSTCGSFLLTEHVAEPENVFVSLGTLDTPMTSKPAYHQFAGSAPAWSAIHDTLPKHDAWP